MFGVILVSIGTFFEEISTVIGKNKVNLHEESPYMMAFLNLFWAAIFYALVILIKKQEFIFQLASLPIFSIRLFLEIIQVYVTVLAITKADRTTFGFVRTITIPLLLLVDLFLGYQIGLLPALGVVLIIAALVITFSHKGIKKEGLSLVIFSAVNAVLTISLFKYNISHYNSIAAEQVLMCSMLVIFFLILTIIKTKENPFIFLTKPVFFLQSAAMGLGGAVISFGYAFSAASVMTAASRSTAIFWSILSGRAYFKERHIVFKILIFALILIGLILLAFK